MASGVRWAARKRGWRNGGGAMAASDAMYYQMREELDRVKAERDALLAALIGRIPGADGELWWTVNVPHVRLVGGGIESADTRWDAFKSLAEAESAILSAAREAAERRRAASEGEAGEKGGA